MKKLSVPYTKDNKILDLITAEELAYIAEIYMPIPYDIMPSGRTYSKEENEYYKEIFYDQIKKAKELDLEVNLLISKPIIDIDRGISLMNRTIAELRKLKELNINVDKVTIGSYTFLQTYGQYLNEMGYKIEISILMDIDSIEKIEQLISTHPYIDTICVSNYFIHKKDELEYVKSKYPKLKLKILANHLCLTDCVNHIEHHNTFSNIIYDKFDTNNLEEWRLASNGKQILNKCKSCIYYADSKDANINILKRTSFIRPEDLYIYDDVISYFKLSGREHRAEDVIRYIRAYGERKYEGSVLTMIDIPFATIYDVDNTLIPNDYGTIKSMCHHQCYKCNYCDGIFNNVKIERR